MVPPRQPVPVQGPLRLQQARRLDPERKVDLMQELTTKLCGNVKDHSPHRWRGWMTWFWCRGKVVIEGGHRGVKCGSNDG